MHAVGGRSKPATARTQNEKNMSKDRAKYILSVQCNDDEALPLEMTRGETGLCTAQLYLYEICACGFLVRWSSSAMPFLMAASGGAVHTDIQNAQQSAHYLVRFYGMEPRFHHDHLCSGQSLPPPIFKDNFHDKLDSECVNNSLPLLLLILGDHGLTSPQVV
ncbi:hypothetical protein OG21DRAFT_1523062 [Imleria badia]|nr:hypothetical protein OG21DRAFT_1523062 [Imleria badia]